MMEREKQGHLGNLLEMTVSQLQELLQRQEKLLSKQKFLASLPDSGQKVKQFVETLRQTIFQRQQCSDGGFASSETQVLQRQRKRPDPQAHSAVRENSHSESGRVVSSAVLHHQSHGERHGDAGEPDVRGKTDEETDTAASLCERLDSLAVSGSTAPDAVDADRTDASGSLEILFPNSYETVMKRNAENSPKKVPFKPNSSLKISDIEQLPEEYKFKSKQGTVAVGIRPERDNAARPGTGPVAHRVAGHVEEESAVHGPAYQFKGAKELSIEDSIQLQNEQREQLQKIQTVHAAERLAERLTIKTIDYNPHFPDMDYRTNGATDDADTCDSDDALEPDDDVLD